MKSICFFLVLIFNLQNHEKLEGRIVGVKDGDTYEVLFPGNILETIRLAHVDCPEKSQAFGKAAKKFGSDFCFGKNVEIVGDGKRDRYKRIIAEIYIEGKCLNKEIVRNGFGWHFKKYSDSEEYSEIEIEARSKKLGLFADPNAIPPWEWRMNQKK